MKPLSLMAAFAISIGAGAAFADDHTTEETAPTAEMTKEAKAEMGAAMQDWFMRASELDGADVYSLDATGQVAWNDGQIFSEVNADWEKIGDARDVVIDGTGEIVGVIAEVGGFLGIGEKEVVLRPSEMTIFSRDGDLAVVTALSKELLEEREEFAEHMK